MENGKFVSYCGLGFLLKGSALLILGRYPEIPKVKAKVNNFGDFGRSKYAVALK
jgi:hypothetical protein